MSEMTRAHIQRVASLLIACIKELADKAQAHDASKLGPVEKPIFDQYEDKLRGLDYGSKEYKDTMEEMKPAIDHHYAENRHHPEHFGVHGISGMTLIDLVEMLCDWAAAVQRHHNGNLLKSLEINRERFGIGDQLYAILLNTCREDPFSVPSDTRAEVDK
jgi:hypothetical protein